MHIFFLLPLRLECMQENHFNAHKQTFINLCTINHTVKLLRVPTFLCDRHIQRNQGVRIASYVLNRGHTGKHFVSSWTSEGQTDDYGRVRGVIEAAESNWALYWTGLIRVSHAAQISSPWHNIIWWKLSSVMKRWGREGPINTWFEKNGRFRHMSGPSQKRARRHTEIYPRKKKPNTNGRTGRYTICQSQGSILVALSQRWHKPKSSWLKLNLSSSARAVSVASESFSLDWWHSVTLVSVTVSLWQVTGGCSRTLQQTYTQPLQFLVFFVAECYCWY